MTSFDVALAAAGVAAEQRQRGLAMGSRSHIEEARKRRETLHEAMVGLEDALSTPVGDVARWRIRVAMAVDHAANRIEEHIADTESPDGLLCHVVAEAPRLACRADRLRHDHSSLSATVERLQMTLGVLDDDDVARYGESLRNQALDFLGQIVRHRQRGADLIYEAFQVDIGGH